MKRGSSQDISLVATPPPSYSVAERKSQTSIYCASRDSTAFAPFPDDPIRRHRGVHGWLEALEVNPISAVSWFWTPGMFVGPRVLNDSMWFWFEDVEGWARVGKGPKVRIGANSLLLIPRGAEHEIHHEGSEARLEAVHFHVTVYGGVNFLELLGFPTCIRASGESAALIGAVSSALSREFAIRSPGWTRSMACDITRVLFELLRFHGSEFLPARSTELQHELLRLLPALDWLSANLSRSNIRVADLASHVHVCESQFRKLFLKTMGISPVRFVQRQRVERACAMLVATDDPIDQIADACGFADVPFFYRVFHAWTSTSPRQYRADVLSGRRDRLTS